MGGIISRFSRASSRASPNTSRNLKAFNACTERESNVDGSGNEIGDSFLPPQSSPEQREQRGHIRIEDNLLSRSAVFLEEQVENTDSSLQNEPPEKILIQNEWTGNSSKAPTQRKWICADDFLTEEQFQFVKDNMQTLRVTRQSENLEFYENKLKSKPAPGYTIDELVKMKGKYNMLRKELDHGCLQWLFPIPRSSGKNSHAQPLRSYEAEAIKVNMRLMERFLAAYMMILDFYGMELKSDITGEVCRGQGWVHRYKYLNNHPKDFMRITRILTCLDCFGLAHFQFPWITFMIKELFEHKQLKVPLKSVHFWIGVISNVNDKLACQHLLEDFNVSGSNDSSNENRNPEWHNENQEKNQGAGIISCSNSEWRNACLGHLDDTEQGLLIATVPPSDNEPELTSSDFLSDDEFAFIGLATCGNVTEEMHNDNKPDHGQPNEDNAGAVETDLSGKGPSSADEDVLRDDERVCKICLEEQVQIAFIPCGHAMACSGCALMIKTCAICRQDIQNVMRIYLS